MKKLLLILALVFPYQALAINITVPQSTAFGQVLRGNATGGSYTPVATSTLGFASAGFDSWMMFNNYLTPTTTLGIIVNASSTISALTINGTATSTNLLVTSSTTLANFTALNSTSTNATTTNLYISGIASTSQLFATTASTTRIFVGNGAAGTPSIAFAADTDTGFYFGGSNTIGFSANGQSIGTFSHAGGTATLASVGRIQATNGQYTSAPNVSINFSPSNGAAINAMTVNATAPYNVGVASTTPWARFSINSISAGNIPQFIIASSTGAGATSTAMIVTSVGNVGVGTSTPQLPLVVQGDSFLATSTGNVTGLILMASDDTCHRLVVSTLNVITASTVTCPY